MKSGPLWFLLGLGLAWVEAIARPLVAGVPDPRILALAFVLVRTSRRRMAPRVLGLALSAPAFGGGEAGPWLLGAGAAALLLFPLRRNLRVDHPLTVMFGALIVWSSLFVAHELGVLLGRPLGWPGGVASWVSAITTLVALPLVCELAAALGRWMPFLPRLDPDPADPGFLRGSLPRPVARG